MDNFCTNCGAKIEKDYKFCINCGTKIDKSDITDNTHTFKSMPDNYEKEKAKTELKRIVGGKIFFNERRKIWIYLNKSAMTLKKP